MTQTATDWMFDQLWETPKDKLAWFKILMKAEEMHKEQIINAAANHCYPTEGEALRYAEQYYNETYK